MARMRRKFADRNIGSDDKKAAKTQEKKSWSGDYGKKEDPSQDTGGKFPSKKEWYAEKGDPTQHKTVNEIDRLTEKWASKGKDFTKTQQYKGMQNQLFGISANRGGYRGKIWDDDPTLNTGNKIGDDYRRSVLNAVKYSGAEGIKKINPQTIRLGLENDPDQFFRFNQQLMEANPVAYETARPVSSGKAGRDIIGLTGPGRILTGIGGKLGDMGTATKEGLAKIFPGAAKDFGAEYERLQSNYPWNRKKDKTDEVVTATLDAITDPTTSPHRVIETEEQEDIFNPMDVWDEGFGIETIGSDYDTQGFYDAYDRMSPTDKYKLHSTLQERGGFEKPRTEGWEFPDDSPAGGSGQKGEEWGDVDWKRIVEQAGYPEGIETMRTSYNPGTDLQQTSELGLPMDMGWQTNPYEKLSLDELINLGASEDQISEYLNISQAAGGGLASIDPYRGTVGGGMNPSGWSPDPTARSVTGYQHGGISTMNPMGATLGGGMQNMMGAGIMAGGNPMDFNNLRNTNKYYGAF